MNRETIYIGCDPGSSGGFVILSSSGEVLDVFKTPTSAIEYQDALKKYSDFDKYRVILVKEKVHSQPRHGGKANFTFGHTIGVLETALHFMKITYFDITPQSWMKYYMMKKDKQETQTEWKKRLLVKAKLTFPGKQVYLWNADAFLIAFYAMQVYR